MRARIEPRLDRLLRSLTRGSVPPEVAANPVREPLGAEHLAERARKVTLAQRLSPRREPRLSLAKPAGLARLDETHEIMRAARTYLETIQAADVGPAGIWFLDNYHLIEQHIQEVRQTLPRSHYRELPTLTAGPLAGHPRVFELATTLVAHSEGRLDRDTLDRFFSAVQEISPLGLGELWALPGMVRLALIDNVRRMVVRIIRRLHEVEDADEWADRIERAGERSDDDLQLTLTAFLARLRPLTHHFVSRLLHQLRVAPVPSPPLAKLEQWIQHTDLRAEDSGARSSQQLAVTQLIMSNSITSLRLTSRLDWVSFVETQSRTEHILARDPSGFYLRMSPSTRDAYRHAVERLARASPATEIEVAEAAIELTTEAAGRDEPSSRQGHVGYFLVDTGLRRLETKLGYRLGLLERLHRWALDRPHVPFLGGILLVTALLLAGLVALVGPTSPGVAWILILCALLPALDVASAVVNQVLTVVLPPRLLPRLEVSSEDDPGAIRTAVVVPILLPNLAAVADALEHLEVQYLANPQPYLRFALLGDFTDAPTETVSGDAEIVAAASAGIRALGDRYGDFFHLLHRARRFDPGQGCWMGWERKRGKLTQLNAFLRGTADTAFATVVGDSAQLKRVRFVITLDADTHLPTEAAGHLIGTLAHPLNRPVFDARTGHVVQGYGVLQPRVAVSLTSARASPFATLYAGRLGVDPYTTAVSDLYQDLHGEGSYTGKGIYDVDAFERATQGRFPEHTLLSHDLIEGGYVRAGLVTDVIVYDDYPARYSTFTRRKHRWMRGDWQLLAWLGWRAPGIDPPQPNALSMLSRIKILDNLRRSLAEISQLVLLLAGWFFLPGGPVLWSALLVLVLATPWLVSVALACLRPPRHRSWRAYYALVASDALPGAKQLFLAVSFLPHQAWVSADAIGRTLWRLYVSHRYLLEWQTAAQSETALGSSPETAPRSMRPATAAALVVSGGGWAVLTQGPLPWVESGGAILPFVVAWASASLLARTLSRPTDQRRERLSDADTATLRRHARLHWAFFERFTTPETGWLAPDNFQDDPLPAIALRTSPTNMGLQLMATVSAHDLGFITLDDMITRLEFALDTMAKLERHEGHFFNWYSLETRQVLEPAYISTVDSGNLAGHCLALRHACSTLATRPGVDGLGERLQAIAARSYRLFDEMKFGFLFDPQQKLFAIGYQPRTRTLDTSRYDLLASECRLASFLAVARNEVPVEHWFRLGRTLTRVGGDVALASWSGSMFEYLMPLLVMRSYPGTLLDQTHRGAVKRQAAYGRGRGVPWGISESAYNLRDRHLTYQYSAFGVPDLALKRGAGKDLVVAPYATLLAAQVEPKLALANLARLEALGMVGPYGFRDALDFTRPLPGRDEAPVSTYMAHHIGMGLVAMTNVLLEDIWQERFHADAVVRSAELLLHERVPRRVALSKPLDPAPVAAPVETSGEHSGERYFEEVDAPNPHVALLGRAPYTLMVSHCGAGSSQYEDLAVTRFRADGTSDNTGQFCYLKDLTSGRAWSAAHQPLCVPADRYRAVLAPHRVTFQRVDGPIETVTEIAVVPEDGAETRRVTVTNSGSEPRIIELTSYGEIVLGSAAADRAHVAFANLFVETEWHAWCSAITATRRPRSPEERTLFCAHVVDARPGQPVSCETDRGRFVGRGRSTRRPVALERDGPLSGTVGTVLDPIFALRVRIELAPGASEQVAFTTLVAPTRAAAFLLADRYHNPLAAQRALDLAWTSTQVELAELQVTPSDAATFQEMAGAILYPTPALGGGAQALERNQGSIPLLWSLGLSGDLPIVLATIETQDGLPTMKQLFAAHHYWRRRGLSVDLVLLNLQPSLYLKDLAGEISAGVYGSSDSGMRDRPGGVHILQSDQLAPAVDLMVRATARIHVRCDGLPLWEHQGQPAPVSSVGASAPTPRDPSRARRSEPPGHGTADAWSLTPGGLATRRDAAAGSALLRAPARAGSASSFDNGLGGLTKEGAYQIRVDGDELPPAPWANVVATPAGGFLVTERGGGFTWAGSSYFYRLTPWHNDPVSDPPGETLYLRDESTGEIWSATPAPVTHGGEFTVRHDAGTSTFEHEHDGIKTHLTLGMAEGTAVKISRLVISNLSGRPRRLSVVAYVEWTLGVLRERTQHQVQTSFDPALRAILARNFFEPEFAGWVAFCATSEAVSSYTGSRRTFLGRNGQAQSPAGLRRPRLDGRTGAGVDPCAALQSLISLPAGATHELTVLLGAAPGEAEARTAIEAHGGNASAAQALERSTEVWSRRLSTIRVHTPEPTFDHMINRWTMYQALSCRMWARSGLYQSSGAYGFRDQLQDVMAFVYAEPALVRAHILRASGRQFLDGDVQHWWHEGSGRGVRTRFSDDLAWLPYVVARYVRVTGDLSVLGEQVNYLEMRALEPEEHEFYGQPEQSQQTGSVQEHCVRALRRACTAGTHGLPLMGGGDWNDGMNRVGAAGRGESVWLAWFLISTLRHFAEFMSPAERQDLLPHADAYAKAAEAHGWDGAWYRRAYFDDGSPMGSIDNDECRIDAIAQSWSIISGAASADRQALALAAFESQLVDQEARLLLLLAPPFDRTTHDPGYILGYPPGIRENGAQYTHGALWSVLATALHGDGDRAFTLFQMLNPLTLTQTRAQVARYRVEPYVVAADVYSAAGQRGRGGWTWYTGSASWMYRIGLESLLGFDKRGDTLTISPVVPRDWPGFSIEYRHGQTDYLIEVVLDAGRASETQVDGQILDGGTIKLVDDHQTHRIQARRAPGPVSS